MLDIVVSGGLAVLPSGPQEADIGVTGEKIAAIGAPGSLAALGAGRVVDAAGQIVIPGGIDPHVHCNWPMPMPGVAQPTLTEPASRVSLSGFARRHDHDDRLRPSRGQRHDSAGNRTAAAAVGGRLLWRLRLSHDAARQDRARAPRRACRGSAGRACLGQDVHDRHHPLAARAAWSISATSGRC